MNNIKITISFITVWFIAVLAIVYIKNHHLYPDNIISLNNFLTLGAVLGAILIGIGSNNFAMKQLVINEKSVNIEMAVRYKEHYCQLFSVLRDLVSIKLEAEDVVDLDMIKTLYRKIYDLSDEAELLFDNDIINANIELRNLALKIYDSLSKKNESIMHTSQDIISFRKNMGFIFDDDSVDIIKNQIPGFHKEFLKNQNLIYDFINRDNSNNPCKLLSLYLKHTKILREAKL